LFVDFNEIEKRVDSFSAGLYSANLIVGFTIFGKTEHNDFLACIGVVEEMQRTTIDLETGTGVLVFRQLKILAFDSFDKLQLLIEHIFVIDSVADEFT
jgi:hypothetical protein